MVIAPTVIGKNDLQVRYEMLGAFLIQLDEAPQKSSPFEVRRIESLPGGNGRRVTIGLRSYDENGQEKSEFYRDSDKEFLDMVRDVTTCVVIPDQEIGFLQYSWLDRLAKALPAELRPRPRELFVGDSVCAPNVIAPMADRDAADLGALEVRTESEDDEKITCSIRGNKPGLARVVHFFGSNKTDKATLFEPKK